MTIHKNKDGIFRCVFCNHYAKNLTVKNDKKFYEEHYEEREDFAYYVHCSNCGACGPLEHYSEESAIKAWNRPLEGNKSKVLKIILHADLKEETTIEDFLNKIKNVRRGNNE